MECFANTWSALQMISLLQLYQAMIIPVIWFVLVREGKKLPEQCMIQGHENFCLQHHVF